VACGHRSQYQGQRIAGRKAVVISLNKLGHVDELVGEGCRAPLPFGLGFPRGSNLLTETVRAKPGATYGKGSFHSTDDWWASGLPSPQWKSSRHFASLFERRLERTPPSDWSGERAAALGIEAPEFSGWRQSCVSYFPPPEQKFIVQAFERERRDVGCHKLTRRPSLSKIPGRCGDSQSSARAATPIRTSVLRARNWRLRGRENIKVAELTPNRREKYGQGCRPQRAGMDALKRIVRNYNKDNGAGALKFP